MFAPAHRATWSRSVRLFRAFLVEQSEPDRFYGELAADSAGQVDGWHPLAGALMLDVGGGPGFFADAFQRRGATYVGLDADAGEMRLHGRQPGPRTVLGSGVRLPFADSTFDIAYSSNVLEHVPEPWRVADEMVRVTKVGGTIVCSYTLWWGPWGGHETAPWHLLGGARAARRYERHVGHPPKNVYGESLFPITAADGLHWCESRADIEVLQAIPRYLPQGLQWLARIPVVREVASWNLVFVLRKKAAYDGR